MKKILINYKDSAVEITGAIDFFKKPKIKIWLKKYEEVHISSNHILISDSNFVNNDFLYNFKHSLEHRCKKIELVYSESFLSIINNKIIEEEKFKKFSKEAAKIWQNQYDPKDFLNFCNVIDTQLPNRKLYRLQLLSAYHLCFSQNACNFSVPGAGKTSIVYASYSYLKSLSPNNPKFVNKLLIIGPPSSFQPWEEEYEECFGTPSKSFRLNSESSTSYRKDVLRGTVSEEYELYLITYQSVPNLLEELEMFLHYNSNKVMLVCDEAHKFKNLTGVWAHSILKLAPLSNSRVVLTGTPAPNGYEDLYNLFKFIYPTKNILGFRADYLSKLSSSPNQLHIEELIENLKPYFVRIKKSDLNLPPVNEDSIVNNLHQLEQSVYDKLEEVLSCGHQNKQSVFFRLIQASNNLHLLNKSIDSFQEYEDVLDYDSLDLESVLGSDLFLQLKGLNSDNIPSKHVRVGELAMEIKKRNQKVVIWGVFVDSIKRLHHYLRSLGLKGNYVIGETKNEDFSVLKNKLEKGEISEIEFGNSISKSISREGIIYNFKHSDLDYIITNPTVLGESISLHQICHYSIYFELSYSVAPYVQSKDRIHRVWLKDGKQVKYETHYMHIISNTRSDNKIFDRLQAKFKRMMDVIEHDIPFFNEDVEDEQALMIKEIIEDYQKANM